MARGDPEAARPGKDHAEHLRTIHFGLLAVSFGLLVVWSSRTRADVQNADEQLRSILQAVGRMKANQSWLQDGVRKLASQAPLAAAGGSFPGEMPFKFDTFLARLRESDSTTTVAKVTPVGYWLLPSDWNALGADHLLIHRRSAGPFGPSQTIAPGTLTEFRNMWELFQRPLPLFYPTAFSPVYQYRELYKDGYTLGTGTWQMVVDTDTPDADEDSECHLFPEPVAQSFSDDPVITGRYMYAVAGDCNGPDRRKKRIAIPIRTVLVNVDCMVPLLAAFTDPPRRGSYGNVFKELDDVAGGYSDIDLDVVRRVLDGEKERSADSYELLGARIPVESIARWGMLVVIAVQVYFLVHLGEFQRRIDPTDEAWNVAWIGLYQGIAAKVVFGLTTFVLPVVVVGLMGTRRITDWKDIALALAALVVSGVAGGLSLRAWRHMMVQRREPLIEQS